MGELTVIILNNRSLLWVVLHDLEAPFRERIANITRRVLQMLLTPHKAGIKESSFFCPLFGAVLAVNAHWA